MTESERYYVKEVVGDGELYAIHDKYAFEDYPVMITANYSLAWSITDRLNMYEEILDEQDVIMKNNGLELVDRDYLSK